MIGSLARKLFGSANDRYIKRLYKIVDKINSLEPTITPLSDEELKAKPMSSEKELKKGKY